MTGNPHAPIALVWDQPRQYYKSIGLDLPEQKKGRARIDHHVFEPGVRIPVVSIRNALLMGMKPASLTTPDRYRIINLHQGQVMWMSDSPQEVEQHVRQLANARGHVLVGGLGIGLAVSILATNPEVKSITVVEKSADIIAMVREPAIARLYDVGSKARFGVVCDDLFSYLRYCGLKYDFAFLDIWAPTSQHEFMKTVLPLRKLARRVVTGHIECWNEAEMLGQFRLGITTALSMHNLPTGIPLATYIAKVEKMKPKFDPCVTFYKQVLEGKAGEQHIDSFIEALRNGEHTEWRAE